jgi:large subunit ribosomal protein L21
MYAVVQVAGSQFRVSPKDTITVTTMQQKAGDKVTFDKVLLIDDGKKIAVGAPFVRGASVLGTVLEHGKTDKVIVFKKKRRKGYRVKRGHRQGITRVEITDIKG